MIGPQVVFEVQAGECALPPPSHPPVATVCSVGRACTYCSQLLLVAAQQRCGVDAWGMGLMQARSVEVSGQGDRLWSFL